MPKSEKEVQTEILIEFGSHPDIRLWRQNTGVAYGFHQVQKLFRTVNVLGTMVSHGARQEGARQYNIVMGIMKEMEPTKYMTKGTPDLGGIVTYQTAKGNPFARAIGIECKAEQVTKASEEQYAWGKMMEERGGIWILANSVEVVRERLQKEGFNV